MKKANVLSVLMMIGTLCAVIAAVPYSSAAQAPAQQASPFKDRAEYDAYNAVEQAKDPAAQVEAADKYLAAYPQSKVAERVLTLKLQAYQKLNNPQKIEETATKMLEVNPKSFLALYLFSAAFPQTFNAQDSAADQKLNAAADHAKAALEQVAALQKPANVPDEDFKKQKDELEITLHQTLAFVADKKKDDAAKADELRKIVSLNPNNAAALYNLGVADHTMKPPKDDEAIWAIARAVNITGPGALPPGDQAKIKEYLSTLYSNVHGTEDGLEDLSKQAASSPSFSPDFHVKTREEISAAEPSPTPTPQAAKRELSVKAEELSSYDAIQKYLQAGGQKADDTWELLKGSQLTLPGKVIGAAPAARPKTVQLAVAPELQNQDARFDVEVTLAAPSAKAIAKGDNKTFEGTVDSYRAKPFLLKLVDAKETK